MGFSYFIRGKKTIQILMHHIALACGLKLLDTKPDNSNTKQFTTDKSFILFGAKNLLEFFYFSSTN